MQDITPEGEFVVHIRDGAPKAIDVPIEETTDASVGDAPDTSDGGLKKSRSKKRMRGFIPYLITAIVFSASAFGAGYVFHARQHSADNAALILHGGLAVNEKDLRNLVVAKGLTVYWLGPKVGAKYILNTSLASGISLRCVYSSASAGSSGTPGETYYEIGTFTSPDAFTLTQKAWLQPNGVGFINADGNAVYYDSRDPKNVYVGLKNVDIQVEIFDPRPDQALAAALLQGQIQKIRKD